MDLEYFEELVWFRLTIVFAALGLRDSVASRLAEHEARKIMKDLVTASTSEGTS